MGTLLDPATLGPCRCPLCWDTGRHHTYLAPDAYRDTGQPCPDCEHAAIQTGEPCIYCGRPSGTTSHRTGDPLCPACRRMETGEDTHDQLAARADRWITTLGLTNGAHP